MTEIANIIESNNSKFYGGFISFMSDEVIQVTIKISNENLASIDSLLIGTITELLKNTILMRKPICLKTDSVFSKNS
jgi:hypothetical protein